MTSAAAALPSQTAGIICGQVYRELGQHQPPHSLLLRGETGGVFTACLCSCGWGQDMDANRSTIIGG